MIDDLNRNVRELVRKVLGLAENSVRPADQIMPAGSQTEQRATVRIITDHMVGITRREATYDTATVAESIDAVQVFVASINFFGGTKKDATGIARHGSWAMEQASRLGPRLRLAASIELQAKLGVLLLAEGIPRNLSGVVDATYESRGQVDLTFTAANRETANVPALASATLVMKIQESGGEQTQTIEVVE